MIVNSKSRTGAESLPTVMTALAARGFSVLLPSEEDMRDCAGAIRRMKDEVDLIVVGGGDGSLNCAAPGLLEAGTLRHRAARHRQRPRAHAGVAGDDRRGRRGDRRGETRWIDVGDVNGHPFFNVASLGISADLAMTLTPESKKRFGPLSYPIAAIRVLSRARPFSAEIISPNARARVRSYQIAIGNGVYYGGGMAVHESASIDDHQLHLYSLEMAAVWKLLVIAPSFRAGRHGAWKEVRVQDATRFEIRTRRPMPVNADGEIITTTPAIVSLRPAALGPRAAARRGIRAAQSHNNKRKRHGDLDENSCHRARRALLGRRTRLASDAGRRHALEDLLERLHDLGALRIKEMDEAGIDMQVLSHGAPSAQKLTPSAPSSSARSVNDRLAQRSAPHPTASPASRRCRPSDPEAAADELERCVNKHGFKGAMIHGLANGDVPRRQALLADLRARRDARRADLSASVDAASGGDRGLLQRLRAGIPDVLRAAWGYTVETATQAIRLVLSRRVREAYRSSRSSSAIWARRCRSCSGASTRRSRARARRR